MGSHLSTSSFYQRLGPLSSHNTMAVLVSNLHYIQTLIHFPHFVDYVFLHIFLHVYFVWVFFFSFILFVPLLLFCLLFLPSKSFYTIRIDQSIILCVYGNLPLLSYMQSEREILQGHEHEWHTYRECIEGSGEQ